MRLGRPPLGARTVGAVPVRAVPVRAVPVRAVLGAALAAVAAISLPAAADPAPAADARDLPPIQEARPPLPPAPDPAPVPWQAHLEIGAGLAVSELLATSDGAGNPTPLRFKPAPGFHIDLSWPVLRYLRFTGYVIEHDHAVTFVPGALMLDGSVDAIKAHVYSFGARVSPTLPLGPRVRLWLTAGGGFGRVEYGSFTFTAMGMPPVTIRNRAESFFEIPLGLGGAVDLIPRWLSLHVELTGAFLPSQIGNALEPGQLITGCPMPPTLGCGTMRPVGPMPRLDASFVETIGLSLHL